MVDVGKGESKQQAVKEEIAIAVNARKTGPVLMMVVYIHS
jgi:hypothetical protein